MCRFGILFGLALLVWLAFRGWSVLLLAPAAVLLAAPTRGSRCSPTGPRPSSAARRAFWLKFFPLFLLGTQLGNLMEDIGSVSAIDGFMTERLGPRREVLAVMLAGALATYGGVSLFIAFFEPAQALGPGRSRPENSAYGGSAHVILASRPWLAPSGRSRQAAGRSWDVRDSNGEVRPYGRGLWHSFLYRRLGMLFFAASLTPTLRAAEFLWTQGRALGMFSGGRIRHRRIRPLALGLRKLHSAQRPPRAAHRRDRLRGDCGRLPLAGGRMAEFDPRADGARSPSTRRIPSRSP